MRESVSDGGASRFETFDANLRFVVIRDDEGYGVWRLEELEDGEPLERFSDDDEGYEAAARRWKELSRASRRDPAVWLPRLRNTVFGGLAVWIVSSAVPAVETVIERGGVVFSGGAESVFDRVVYAVGAISFDLWAGATIAYLILWMEVRRRAPATRNT
jgi:hypothetical protein